MLLFDFRQMVLFSRRLHMNDIMGKFEFSFSVPSVGVKEGLSCVFSRAKWCGKARNLALP